MKAFKVALIALAAFFVTVAAAAPIVIGNDYGGSVSTYDMWYNRVKQSGVKVRVEGMCISACTLVLSLPKDQVCVTPTASFGFHLASVGGQPDVETTNALIRRYYPKPIKEWLRSRRLTDDVIYLPGEEVVKMGVFEECQ